MIGLENQFLVFLRAAFYTGFTVCVKLMCIMKELHCITLTLCMVGNFTRFFFFFFFGAQWLCGRVLDSRPRVRASPA